MKLFSIDPKAFLVLGAMFVLCSLLPGKCRHQVSAQEVLEKESAQESVSETRLTADQIFDVGRLREIRLELPAGDWDKLCSQSRDFGSAFAMPSLKPFTDFKADLWIDGVKSERVTIRKKGFIGSLDNEFPSLKVAFDKSPIEGMDRLTLNNNKQDSGLVSQYLSYRLFREAGLPAPRCAFVRVTVNGKYLGIYSNVESIRDDFLKQHFGTSKGKLYEGTIADFYPAALSRIEAKSEKADQDRKELMALAVSLQQPKLTVAELETMIDIDQFIRFWAIESLLGFWDGYCNNQNNFWVYHQPEQGKLYFIPWGADGAFGTFGFGPFGGMFTPVYSQSMLCNRLYHLPGIPERYKGTMDEILRSAWNEEEMLAEIDRIETLVEGHLHPRQARSLSGMDQLRKFIKNRRSQITRALEDEVQIEREPRKPTYFVSVGKTSGTFKTTWQKSARDASTESDGSSELSITLNDKPLDASAVSVVAHPAEPMRWGPPRGDDGGPAPTPPANIVVTGTPEEGESWSFTVALSQEQLASVVDKPIPVMGSFRVGPEPRGFFGPPRQMLGVSGSVTLTSGSLTPGAPVEGRFELDIAEMRGGIFGGRRQGGGGRGRGGRGGGDRN